jgi:N-acetylmuramoyl-L-alanine amidase
MSISVYIDPGHGKGITGTHDPGAIGPTGLVENEITLDVAKRLGHLLREKGIKTVGNALDTTCDDESFEEAIKAANMNNTDLFVSLHCNAATSPKARGVEIWYGITKTSKTLAKAVLNRIGEQLAGGKGKWVKGLRYPLVNRGIKSGNFAVLRKTKMPSILIELAFISNTQEEVWLREPVVRQQFAQAIADGIYDAMSKKGEMV